MGFLSGNVGRPMNETAIARNLIAEIAGHCWRGKGDMLDRVHDAIRHFNPNTAISRRRVRAFWHGEAALVRFGEMLELAETATKEKARQAQMEGARREHADFLDRINRLAGALAARDQEFCREADQAFGRLAGREDDRQGGRPEGRSADAAAMRGGTRGMVDAA